MKETILKHLFVAALVVSPALAMAEEGHEGKHKNRGGKMMQKVDVNKDDQISLDEFLAHKKERFSKIDTDNSGYLSKDELKAGRKEMRKKFKKHKGKHQSCSEEK